MYVCVCMHVCMCVYVCIYGGVCHTADVWVDSVVKAKLLFVDVLAS